MRRDRLKEAVDWVMEATLLGMMHDIEVEDVMRMDADRVVALLSKLPPGAQSDVFIPPHLPQLAGWPNVYYGDPRDWGKE